MNGTWWLPLLKPDQQFETGLPPRMLEHVKALRQAHEELGPQRGLIARAAAISHGAETNVHHSLKSAAKRLERMSALRGWNVEPVGGLDVREITERRDADGKLEGRTIRQGAPLGDVDPGAPLPGFAYKRVSTLANGAGETVLEWKIQSPEAAQRHAAAVAAYAEMAKELPRIEPTPAPAFTDADLCATYTLTDAHIGMLAWRREGGADWDLPIAERVIVGCFAEAVRANPPTETAILNQLGDLLHYDSLSAVTPTSGHILDADGRFTKMVEVAVRVLRRIIGLLLEKHARVHLVLAEGNHDMASSVWLRTMFRALYENEPRITVDDSALPFYLHEFGDVMQVFHHSHLVKFDKIGAKVPAMFPESWGRTRFRYVHTGNYHHRREKDEDGVEVIQHPTMAARDAYAARGAWFAGRAMLVIVYHRNKGEVWRQTFRAEAFEAAA